MQLDFGAARDTLISGSGYSHQVNTFGQMIALARKARRLSQKDLAARIKKEDGDAISPQYLNDIEHDRRNPPSEYLIAQFAKELDLAKDHLCFAAGTLPEELRKTVSDARPERVEAAFKAFRRELKGK